MYRILFIFFTIVNTVAARSCPELGRESMVIDTNLERFVHNVLLNLSDQGDSLSSVSVVVMENSSGSVKCLVNMYARPEGYEFEDHENTYLVVRSSCFFNRLPLALALLDSGADMSDVKTALNAVSDSVITRLAQDVWGSSMSKAFESWARTGILFGEQISANDYRCFEQTPWKLSGIFKKWFTPIQICSYTAGIANSVMMRPHIYESSPAVLSPMGKSLAALKEVLDETDSVCSFSCFGMEDYSDKGVRVFTCFTKTHSITVTIEDVAPDNKAARRIADKIIQKITGGPVYEFLGYSTPKEKYLPCEK